MIKPVEYIKSDGKVYIVTGKDGQGRTTVSLVPGLKEIPEDRPLEKPIEKPEPVEEVKPRRTRKKA